MISVAPARPINYPATTMASSSVLATHSELQDGSIDLKVFVAIQLDPSNVRRQFD
jgi:hypothetical protein